MCVCVRIWFEVNLIPTRKKIILVEIRRTGSVMYRRIDVRNKRRKKRQSRLFSETMIFISCITTHPERNSLVLCENCVILRKTYKNYCNSDKIFRYYLLSSYKHPLVSISALFCQLCLFTLLHYIIINVRVYIYIYIYTHTNV